MCQVVRVKVESEEAMRGRPNGEEVLLVRPALPHTHSLTDVCCIAGVSGY